MKNRNCPNCGAVMEIGENKCPYCGTSYFDISAIPLDRPCFLTLLTKTGQKITAKVMATDITFNYNSQEICSDIGNLIGEYCQSTTLTLNFNLVD